MSSKVKPKYSAHVLVTGRTNHMTQAQDILINTVHYNTCTVMCLYVHTLTDEGLRYLLAEMRDR